MEAQEDRNPYEFAYHAEGCDEDVWYDREQNELLDEDEIADRECSACDAEYRLWAQIIEDANDAFFGFWAFELLRLNDQVEVFGMKPSDLNGRDWDGLRAVRAEINRRRIYNEWKASQKPESQ